MSQAQTDPEGDQGSVVGKKAPDFSLPDQKGETFTLSKVLQTSPIILVFYPGDFRPVCTAQLCHYRDNFQFFRDFGIQIYGVSANTVESHVELAKKYLFPFKLLSDVGLKIAEQFGCKPYFFNTGRARRAVFIINRDGLILYKRIENIPLTWRKAEELIGILRELRKGNLI